MNIVYNVMVFLHIVGAAMIVGIWIGQMKTPPSTPASSTAPCSSSSPVLP